MERGSNRLSTISSLGIPVEKNCEFTRFELRSPAMLAWMTRYTVEPSLNRLVPIKSSRDPISTTTLSKSCRAIVISLSMASLEA